MNESDKQVLKKLIEEKGARLIEDEHLVGLLKDHFPNDPRVVQLLQVSVQEGIPADLLKGKSGVPGQVFRSQLSQRLIENHAVDAKAADWTVGTWAFALGKENEIQQTIPGQQLNIPPKVFTPRKPLDIAGKIWGILMLCFVLSVSNPSAMRHETKLGPATIINTKPLYPDKPYLFGLNPQFSREYHNYYLFSTTKSPNQQGLQSFGILWMVFDLR
jgi:hypothetical protein